MRNLIFICIWLMFLNNSQAGIIYVDADANGANDGSNWTNAYNYLQDGLTTASSGDEIWVAQGIYTPDSSTGEPNGSGDREATFELISGVALRGGYAGVGAANPNERNLRLYETILSGDLNGDDEDVNDLSKLLTEPSRLENSCRVVTSRGCEHNTVLDGFTITAGNANTLSVSLYDRGGGMFNYDSNSILIKCTFSENAAMIFAGGIYNNNSNVTLISCTFTRNFAHQGGGMVNTESDPVLMRCVFNGNQGVNGGGGICNLGSSPMLVYCSFRCNSAPALLLTGGGGGAIYNGSGSPTVTNCVFSGNWAPGGGGLSNVSSNPSINNCTFTGNIGGGSAMVNWWLDCSPTIVNCIFWDGGNEVVNMLGATVDIKYSNIWGGWPGKGNTDVDPCFVEAGYWGDANDPNIIVGPNDHNAIWVDGDYRLLPSSPCIDAGDPNYIPEPNETDLDGRPRVLDGNEDGTAVVDMGAYEYQPVSAIEAVVKIQPRTLNLASKGKWIMCVIRLPEDYNVGEIDCNSVLLEDEIEAERVWLGDEFAVARFSRAAVQEMLGEVETPGEVELVVSGELSDGTIFEGTDTIRVIDKGRRINNLPAKGAKRVIVKRK